jgi:hypothetical protein
MVDYLMSYLLIGTVWSFIHTIRLGSENINRGYQVRLLLFWPITVTAWVVGFIEAFNNTFEDDDRN